VTQIASGVQSFQTKFQVSYVPSRIILCKNLANYFVPNTFNPATSQGTPLTQLHQDSLDYLQRVFPRITTPPAPWAVTGIDWNQNGVPDQPISLNVNGLTVNCYGALLEGEQCLVFFAGGIPNNSAPPTSPNPVWTVTGFSTNPSNPAAPTTDRIAPFFDFKSNRLVSIAGTFPPVSPNPAVISPQALAFPSYLDAYGKAPYAYFSSYKTANGYNRYVYISNPYIGGSAVTSDCQALGVFPYAQSTGASSLVFLNPQTSQLISAGKDTTFGSGTIITAYPGYPPGNAAWAGNPLWSPATATLVYPQGSAGYDDIANFYDRLLGVPTQ
jgi:hypothetical protein